MSSTALFITGLQVLQVQLGHRELNCLHNGHATTVVCHTQEH